MMTLIVNLFGGPGAGKSTTAAIVFAQLKQRGVNVEIAHEYAKDLTWEDRHKAIMYQPYVCAKQMWRVHRLIGQVDVVITDSPILLSLIYGVGHEGFTPAFQAFVVDTFKRWDTLNYLLHRGDYVYQPKGRRQSKASAIGIDLQVEELLGSLKIPFKHITGGGLAASHIVSDIPCLQVS